MIDGIVVAVFRVPSIVATLGTLSVYQGIDFLLAGGKQVTLTELPPGYTGAARATLVGVPIFVLIAVAMVAISAVVLRQTRFGRSVYAVGSRRRRCLGIRTGLVTFVVFSVCGLLSGIAGVLWGVLFGTINATAATGVTLQVIAAVVVGGVNIFGGSGTVVGAALGAVFLGFISNALILPRLCSSLQALYGVGRHRRRPGRRSCCVGSSDRRPGGDGVGRRRPTLGGDAGPLGGAPPGGAPCADRLRHDHLLIFLSGRNFANLISAVMVAIVSLPMALIIIAGEIDLSVESMVGLSASILGYLYAAGVPIELAIVVVLVVGALCGLLNGILVTRLGLPSLVVTLGTLALYRGLALVVLESRGISSFPTWFTTFGFRSVPGLPIPWRSCCTSPSRSSSPPCSTGLDRQRCRDRQEPGGVPVLGRAGRAHQAVALRALRHGRRAAGC